MDTTRNPRQPRIPSLALACLLAALGTVACSKAKESADEARAQAKAAGDRAAAAVKDSANAVAETAKEKTAEVAAQAKQASGELVDTVKEKSAEALAAAKEKTAAVKEDVAARRDALVRDLQHGLGQADAGIATLQQRLAHAQGSGKQELEDSLAALRTKRSELHDRLQKLGTSTGAAWDDLAAGARSAEQDLAAAIDKALERFK